MNKFLAHIREVDAIAHVVRCFDDENVTHVSSSINPLDDIDTVSTELKLADLETLQNKLNILEKKTKTGDKEIKTQIKIVEQLQNQLNNDERIDYNIFNNKDFIFYNSLNLITSKPMLYICNVDENSIISGNNFSNSIREKVKKEFSEPVIISAAIEAQIAEFESKNDKLEMLKDLGYWTLLLG